jgi:hypothetical protein
MIFYTVCSAWLTSQNSNIQVFLLQDKNPIRLKFVVSDKYSLVLHIKHANNTSLLKGYMDTLEKYHALKAEKHVFWSWILKRRIASNSNKLRWWKILYAIFWVLIFIDVQMISVCLISQNWALQMIGILMRNEKAVKIHTSIRKTIRTKYEPAWWGKIVVKQF